MIISQHMLRCVLFILLATCVLTLNCQVDEERHRISLGMKKSYIGNASNASIISNHGTDDGSFDGIAAVDDTLQQNDDLPHTEKMFGCDNEARAVLEQAETRASVLPLQVVLDDSDGSDLDNATVSQEIVNLTDMAAKKSDRRMKKKAKEERSVLVSVIFQGCVSLHNFLSGLTFPSIAIIA